MWKPLLAAGLSGLQAYDVVSVPQLRRREWASFYNNLSKITIAETLHCIMYISAGKYMTCGERKVKSFGGGGAVDLPLPSAARPQPIDETLSTQHCPMFLP
jgi:hypothetical protein